MVTTGEMAEWSKAPDSKSAGELRTIKALREFLSATLPCFLPKSLGHGRKLRMSFPTLVIRVEAASVPVRRAHQFPPNWFSGDPAAANSRRKPRPVVDAVSVKRCAFASASLSRRLKKQPLCA
jgi:hypothetical protein